MPLVIFASVFACAMRAAAMRRELYSVSNGSGGAQSGNKMVMALAVNNGTSAALARGSVWMVFEYLPFDLNGTIEQLREQEGQLTVAEVKRVVYDILKALEFCHSRNVIHRDLKSTSQKLCPQPNW